MSYLVLARKFRPQSFDDVSGQEHVTRTLRNAITRNKVAHAYVFAGPRGVGKTSIARIFSKCLNCEKGPTANPCLVCSNCTSITLGSSLAVREIDGASHNSVDNVRELIESFRSLPAPGSKYKIYIIDEVHMLSLSAFNALLKSLEEPPPHTVFVLATTEPQKIPDTVLSRCQRHDLRALSNEQVEERLREIALAEKLVMEPEVVRMISRLSDGSMRDAQSLLDRVQSFCDEKITVREVGKVLGVVDRDVLFRLTHAVCARDAALVLNELNEAFSYGLDPALFLKEFVAHWRELLIAKTAGQEALVRIGLSAEESAQFVSTVQPMSAHDVQDLAFLAREGADAALRSAYPKYALEALLVRMATREPVLEIGHLLAQLREKGSSTVSGAERLSNRAEPETPKIVRHPTTGATAAPTHSIAGQSVATQSVPPPKREERASGALVWEDFVQQSRAIAGSMLAEQLKRLSVEQFSLGTLKAHGPEFSITYLLQKDNKEKLEKALDSFANHGSWVVSLVQGAAAGGAEPGSLLERERKIAVQSREEKERDISNHPKVKSLQRAFPGSTIENIRIKE